VGRRSRVTRDHAFPPLTIPLYRQPRSSFLSPGMKTREASNPCRFVADSAAEGGMQFGGEGKRGSGWSS